MKRIINAVLGIPINAKGEFLLSQRFAPKNSATHLKWQFVGGGMEFGETPEETLIREFQEEIQCAPKLLHPHPLVKISLWDDPASKEPIDTQIVLITYLVDIGKQKPVVTNDPETSAARWFSLKEALQLPVLPQTHEFLQDAKKLSEQLAIK